MPKSVLKSLPLVTFLLASPFAAAVPLTYTVTTSGVVQLNAIPALPLGAGIEDGDAYTLTLTYTTDSEAIGVDGTYRGTGSVVFTAGDQTRTQTFGMNTSGFGVDQFTIDDPSGYTNVLHLYAGEFQSPAIGYHVYVGWKDGQYTLPDLTTSQALQFGNGFALTAEVTYFDPDAGITGQIWLASTATSVAVTAVPEPATYGMLLAGGALVALVARRRRAGSND